MPNKNLRIGIIGVGVYSVFAHIPGFQKSEQVDLIAISRRNPERLKMAQEAFDIPHAYVDWQEMLDKVELDAVVISTPNHLHAQPASKALDNGLHVLVDKPLALRSDDAWSLVKKANSANRVLMVGYTGRFEGIWQTVKDAVDSGVLGQVRQINMANCFYRRWFWESDNLPEDVEGTLNSLAQQSGLPFEFFSDWGHEWHNNPSQMGGGSFVDSGTHHVDRALWLAGAPAIEVSAMMESHGSPTETFVNVQARLANGVLVSMTSADAVPQGLFGGIRHLMIVGEEGILVDDSAGNIWIYQDGHNKKLESKFSDKTAQDVFVDAIKYGDTDYPQADEGAYAVDFIEAMYLSAAEKKIVTIQGRDL